MPRRLTVIVRSIPRRMMILLVHSYIEITILHRVTKMCDVFLKKIKEEKLKSRIHRAKGLMYINVKINWKPIRAMILMLFKTI